MIPSVISIPAHTITIGGTDVAELVAQATAYTAQVPEVLCLKTAPDAQELLGDLVKLKGMIEKQRVAAKEPFLDAGKKIDAAAKVYTTPLIALETTVRAKLQTYQWEVERQRNAALNAQREAELAAAEDAAKSGRTPALATSAAVYIPDAAEVKTRGYQELRIDEALLPDAYWTPDESSIRADLARGVTIPGAQMVTVQRVVAR